MKDITFVDLEVTLNTCRVVDIGAVRSDRTPFHENSFDNLLLFLHQVPYIGGHNILKHDLSYLKPQFEKAGCRQPKIIDTLYLSSLLFPEKLHHQLSKDDKLQADKPNNPVNDSLKSLLLFEEEQNAFERLDSMLKMIYYGLLHDTDEFGGFFDYIDYAPDILDDLSGSILERFSKDICISSPLAELIISYPVELAYGLSLINCWNSSSGIPLWVLHNYPKVGWVMERLRDTPCENNECAYCRGAFNGKEGLKYFFKYDSFRTYEGEDLQQKAVEAAIEGESLLAVFPTGGGKSITFQLPALMSGKRIKGLTVVISPLQSLMKDQVDNLWKNEIMDVVTINGMLDPVERAHAIQRVEEGSVSILYISPESLRSKTIERLLVGRKVVRFVIDEAHCFSAWGQDFRVDYLYIGDFIRLLQEQKGGKQAIPVSCFTATAKQNVIQDIKDYFFEKLNIRFKTFDRITVSPRFDDTQKEEAIRIIKKLISTRSRKHVNGEIPESRIDYISDHLGISRQEVMLVIRLLREENILADACDLTAYIKKGENSNRSLETVLLYNRLDEYLLSVFTAKEQSFNLKELRKEAEIETGKSISPDKLNRLLNFWSEKNWIKRIYLDKAHNYVTIARTGSVLDLEELTEGRHLLSDFIIRYLFEKTGQSSELEQSGNILVEFSMLELKEAYEKDVRKQLFGHTIRMEDIEDTLLYLSRIEALQIEGGFLVLYNRLQIDRLVLNNKMQYKQDDYHKLELFYANKIQQINIVGEYVRKMLSGNSDALEFVDDYFQLNYSSFLQKYFPGKRRDEINRKMTNTKLQRLLGELSETQLEIVKDDRPGSIVVMAGPGSGKTRVLVHKLAYLLLEEDVKHEQLLMLTFSRAAASEFRRRLWDLIGTAAGYVEIKTFHSYCFDLLGLQGSLEKSSSVIIDAVGKIDNGEVEINRITKTVLVIDEAQDMTEDEFALVEALIRKNEDLKVVAVGDDDQNIYSFRRSNSRYMRKLVDEYGARTHDLLVNFRSKKCLVEFANRFWETIPERMKQSRIISHDQDEGEIRIVQYQSPNMVIPLVQDICATPLIGTTCVLTQTNWEAIQVACLLKDKRMPVRLIQSNEGFRLCDMDEMRFFNRILGSQAEVHLIDEVCWAEAKQAIKNEYCEATSWEICRGIIQNFEQLYPCKYRSDWETYLFESKLEDFYAVRGETIVVSTIHKAKGKEFDNVFLLLNDNRDLLGDNQPVTDEKRREIYVALTRAKNKLSIHLNSYYPEIFGNEEKIIRFDKAYYPMPERLLFLLTHRDVWLDFFKDARRQESIGNLKSGMPLRLMEGGCCDSSDKEVVRFSNSFKKEIEKWLDKGYELKEARVNFVVYWKKTGEEEEVKVLLPEIVLVKVRNLNVSELMIL